MHCFLGRLNVLRTSFHAHMPTFDLGQNSWPIWPDGILVQNRYELVQNWYEFFFFYRILHFILVHLNVISTSFHAHMATFDLDQNSWPIWPSGILVQNRYELVKNWYVFFYYFFRKEFCISFLDVIICYVQVVMHTRRHLI